MTDQFASSLVQGERNIAVSALDGLTALPTKEKIGKTAPVQKDKALFLIVQVFLQGPDQFTGKERRPAGDRLDLFKVHNLDLGERPLHNAFRKIDKAILAVYGMKITCHRGCCRTKNDRGALKACP